jgi:hypothetical protein
VSPENRQAELLAHWLSESQGGDVRPEPPKGLDPEVVDAILALRPDQAPPARVTLDDILFEVADGPLAEAVDPAAAGRLREWVDGDWSADSGSPAAGSPEQSLLDELDPDVVDAISTLRPERAPAARVSIDDILAEVRTGPLAAPAVAANDAAPSNVVSLSAARAATTPAATSHAGSTQPEVDASAPRDVAIDKTAPRLPKRSLPRWLWPSVGGLAMAATAMLFVMPVANQAMDAPALDEIGAAYEGAPASTPVTTDGATQPELERSNDGSGKKRPKAKRARTASPRPSAASGPMAAPNQDPAEIADAVSPDMARPMDEMDEDLDVRAEGAEKAAIGDLEAQTASAESPYAQGNHGLLGGETGTLDDGIGHSPASSLEALGYLSSGGDDSDGDARNRRGSGSSGERKADRARDENGGAALDASVGAGGAGSSSIGGIGGLTGGAHSGAHSGGDRSAELDALEERGESSGSTASPGGGGRWVDTPVAPQGAAASTRTTSDRRSRGDGRYRSDASDETVQAERETARDPAPMRDLDPAPAPQPEPEPDANVAPRAAAAAPPPAPPATPPAVSEPGESEEAYSEQPATGQADAGGAFGYDAEDDDALGAGMDELESVSSGSVSKSAESRSPRRETRKPMKKAKDRVRLGAPGASKAAQEPMFDDAAAPADNMDLASLRAQAWPLNAAPNPRSRHPDLEATYAQVDAARAAGDHAALISALESLMTARAPLVVHDAAYNLARHHLTIGRRDLALTAIARGLGTGGGFPASRARLLALQGEILEQKGDTQGAAESYRRALQSR